jgi:acetamidase/formamidase
MKRVAAARSQNEAAIAAVEAVAGVDVGDLIAIEVLDHPR